LDFPRNAPNFPTTEASGKMVATPKKSAIAMKIIKRVSLKIADPLHVISVGIITNYYM